MPFIIGDASGPGEAVGRGMVGGSAFCHMVRACEADCDDVAERDTLI